MTGDGRRAERPAWRWALRAFGVVYVGFLVGLPAGSVIWRTLAPGVGSAWHAITTPAGVHAFELTIECTLVAVACNTVFGIGIALLLARHRFPARRWWRR